MYKELIEQFRDKAAQNKFKGYAGIARDYTRAADALEEINREYESISKTLNEAAELIRKKDAKYDKLLKAAHSMHTWIFLNSFDEQEAYDECGLTPEMNALLGYGGQFIAEMPKEEK